MTVRDILKYFLKLGATGFGGPLSLIHQMRQELVHQKNQISNSEFDQAFTLIKAMPGPIAFQMAVYCGHRLAGFWGGFAAGVGLIFPSFLMMIGIGIMYSQFSHNSRIDAILRGMQYAVAAVILLSLKSFILTYRKNILFWLIAAVSAVVFYFGYLPESILIIGFGLILVLVTQIKPQQSSFFALGGLFVLDYEKLFALFRVCFTAGALVFGTGLAAFPFLQRAFVDELGLIDLKTFSDGISFGQMTPGPVTISTTFIGYKIAQLPGAFVATLGIFLPPFIHMSTWFPHALNWFSKQKWIQPFILGATSAVVGCILVTVIKMNSQEFAQIRFWIIFSITSLVLIFRPKTSILKIIMTMGLLNLLYLLTT